MPKGVMYGPPEFRAAIVEGNIRRMKKLAAQAERHLKQHGDLRTHLEILKMEIAKLEHRRARERR